MNVFRNIKAVTGVLVSCLLSGCADCTVLPLAVDYEDIAVGGELAERMDANFDRLESERYLPANVFLTEEQSGWWPGDTEGRTILALVLEARASGREPLYLEEIISLIPSHLNEKGYMGTIYEGKMNEQQLSGNGWMLRALCEYYAWKQDAEVLKTIESISSNLFISGKGKYALYPLERTEADGEEGAESGNISKETDNWMLSTDVGCVFIGMEGLIHAYEYVRTPQMAEVIEEMIGRFLEMDLLAIKAQTHATLTACRGLMRYASLSGKNEYADEAEKRWLLYKAHGMTENYENYNWFNRFDTWTEPCAIIDSYMLAVQLWQHTGKAEYRDDAELIYWNAICHTQRHNGGFGCDNCPGEASGPSLKVSAPEAWWCCTMRGGEGLASAAKYSYWTDGNELYIPFYRESGLKLDGLVLKQNTDYPFGNSVEIEVLENTLGGFTLSLPAPQWMKDIRLELNGEEVASESIDGFISLKDDFEAGSILTLTYSLETYRAEVLNRENTAEDQYRMMYGPLLLGRETEGGELTPVYHLLDANVWDKDKYSKLILFDE